MTKAFEFIKLLRGEKMKYIFSAFIGFFGYFTEITANTDTGDQFFISCIYQDINKTPAKTEEFPVKSTDIITATKILLHNCPIALSYRYSGFGAKINEPNQIFHLHGEQNNHCAYNSFNAVGDNFTLLCLKKP